MALVLALLLPGAAQAQACKVSGPPEQRGWKLVWQDEFQGGKLDTTKWTVLVREESKHGELQYYLPDEVYLDGGMLHLRTQQRSFGPMKYTSGRLDTSGKFAPVYGRFEVCAKLPGGRGLWPAHWLYPQNRDWAMEWAMAQAVAAGQERAIPEYRPWYSEIDIMEFLGHEPNVVYGTLHYKSFQGESRSTSGNWHADVDFTRGFHLFTVEWEPDSMRWYVDDRLIHTSVVGIPHTPHFIILNSAVGGSWPGNPDSTTVFPQYHDIDYVRVYARPAYRGVGAPPPPQRRPVQRTESVMH